MRKSITLLKTDDAPRAVFDMIPVLVSTLDSDNWMAAEIRSGQHWGRDNQVHDGCAQLYLNPGEATKAFGEPYPFGSASGRDLEEYIRLGAVLKLDTSRPIVRHLLGNTDGEADLDNEIVKPVDPTDFWYHEPGALD